MDESHRNSSKVSSLSLLFVFLCSVVLVFSAPTTVPTANLLVQKHVTADPFPFYGEGKNLTVQVNIFNVADGVAYEVSVSDPWPSSFNILTGKTNAKFPEIPAGGKAELNLTLSPNFHGDFASFQAVVHYKPNENSDSNMIGYSNPVRNMTILTGELFEKLTAKHYREWALFSGLSLMTVLLPLFVWLKVQIDFPNGLPVTKKRD